MQHSTSLSGPFCFPLFCIVSYCCSLAMNTSTGRKALEMRFIKSGHPLTYSTGGGRQLFVFVTLETAIHIFVLGDNLQFNIMEYDTTPYVGMALEKK